MRRYLEQSGYSCWMAPDDVRGMDPWAEQILEAIEGCRVMVVLLSANANASRHVSREVNLALGRGKAILPVRIEEVPPEGALEYLLSLVQRVDAFPPPFRTHLEQIQAHLAAVLAQPIEASVATPRSAGQRRRRPTVNPMLAAVGGAALGAAILLSLVFWPRADPGATAGSPGPTATSPAPTGVSRVPIRSFDDLSAALTAQLVTRDGPASYAEYVRRADNTGQLETELPAEWNDLSGITFVDPSGTPVGVMIAASTDLSRIYQAFDTAGFFVGGSSDAAPTFDSDAFLELLRPNFVQSCLLAGRHEVDLRQVDGTHLVGDLVVWRSCRGSATLIVQAGLLRGDGLVAYQLDMRANRPADVAAIRHALERLRVLVPFIVTPGGAPATPTPGPPG
jgi:hypothetical protein